MFMMAKRWISISLFAVLIAGIYLYPRLRSPIIQMKDVPVQSMDQIVPKGARENEILVLLERLLKSNDPRARDLAIGLSRGESPLLRQASARVIGNYDDPAAWIAHQALLRDEVAAIRSDAIRALGAKPGYERERELDRLLQSPLSKSDELYALSSLARISASASKRKEALRSLIELAKSGQEGDSIESIVLQNNAFMEIASFAEAAPEVSGLAVWIISQGKNPSLMRLAIQNLIQRKDPGLTPLLPRLIASEHVEIRIESMAALHQLCPAGRWQWIEERLTKDLDPRVRRAALQEVARLSGPDALSFAERLSANRTVQKSEQAQLEATLTDLRKKRRSPACSSR